MKPSYRSEAVLILALMLCVCVSPCEIHTNPIPDYFRKAIPSTVGQIITDVDGLDHVLDHNQFSYEYRWSGSNYCMGACDNQAAYFTPTTGTITVDNLHNELTVSEFHLCRVSSKEQVSQTARIRRTNKSSGVESVAFNGKYFSPIVTNVLSCSCQDSITDLDMESLKNSVHNYASSPGTQV